LEKEIWSFAVCTIKRIRESNLEKILTFLSPADRLRPTDEKTKALSVGLNLSVGAARKGYDFQLV
jgi:hypothetical protein